MKNLESPITPNKKELQNLNSPLSLTTNSPKKKRKGHQIPKMKITSECLRSLKSSKSAFLGKMEALPQLCSKNKHFTETNTSHSLRRNSKTSGMIESIAGNPLDSERNLLADSIIIKNKDTQNNQKEEFSTFNNLMNSSIKTPQTENTNSHLNKVNLTQIMDVLSTIITTSNVNDNMKRDLINKLNTCQQTPQTLQLNTPVNQTTENSEILETNMNVETNVRIESRRNSEGRRQEWSNRVENETELKSLNSKRTVREKENLLRKFNSITERQEKRTVDVWEENTFSLLKNGSDKRTRERNEIILQYLNENVASITNLCKVINMQHNFIQQLLAEKEQQANQIKMLSIVNSH